MNTTSTHRNDTASYDIGPCGHNKLSVYLPTMAVTGPLRKELKRMFGTPSALYMKPVGKVFGEEWVMENGSSLLLKLQKRSSWKAVFNSVNS